MGTARAGELKEATTQWQRSTATLNTLTGQRMAAKATLAERTKNHEKSVHHFCLALFVLFCPEL
jgi:hypothetical protein